LDRKEEPMLRSSVRATLVAGIAALAMVGPAVASLTISGSAHTPPARVAASQYAQDFKHGMRESNAYKSTTKKSKSSKSKKTDTAGEASTKTNTAK